MSIETMGTWNNDPLPDPDALITRAWLLEAKKELARINDEIPKLELRRNALLPLIQVYDVGLAPHKTLPVDIIREIFLCAAQSTSLEANLNDILSPRLDHLPDIRLIISQVCSLWRSVALDTSNLWSDVRVDFETGDTTLLLEVLAVWLSRSGKYPLALNIGGAVDDPRIADQLTPHSNRFRCLSIRSENPLLNLPAGSMRLLETLEIEYYYDDSWPLAPIHAFDGAASLRCLTFRGLDEGVCGTLNLELFAIPWHQLTEFNLHDISTPPLQCYSILDRCKAFTTTRLDIFRMFHVEPPQLTENIKLPRLRTLELSGDDVAAYARFLTTFWGCLGQPRPIPWLGLVGRGRVIY
ncbi:hypothetical protein C8R44DRAFT_984160 [Mycena epipterygia]|nr:hypothetical protein C8R44DRAFT_984160 [Mycena epipterygia]